MKEYQVAGTTGLTELEEQVGDLIADGWKCQGGVSATAYHREGTDENTTWFYQAMTREESK